MTTESDGAAGGDRPLTVVDAVRADLELLPAPLRACAEALAAEALAADIDSGAAVAMCTRELRATMEGLRTRARLLAGPAAPDHGVNGPDDGDSAYEEPDSGANPQVKGSPVADLVTRIADRRRAPSV